MVITPLDKENLQLEYHKLYPKYERLGKNLKQALTEFLSNAHIDVLDVQDRVKDFESLCEKSERKKYKKPLKEAGDICGLRVICYFPSDIEEVSALIKHEFNIIESEDKADLLEPDRFGYRSIHFVVTVKRGWLNAPNYRDLAGLKAEIQVRTILMHAWADIEQKLAYKKKEYVPYKFRRKLSQISAFFEAADEQFDNLRKEKEQYIEILASDEAKTTGRFDIKQQVNIDSLQAFLNFYFPDRASNPNIITSLLDEMIATKITFQEFIDAYEKTKDILPQIENKLRKHKGLEEPLVWSQIGVARKILEISIDRFYEYRGIPKTPSRKETSWVSTTNEGRELLSKKISE